MQYPIRNEFPLLDSDCSDIRQSEGVGSLMGWPHQVAQEPKVGRFVNLYMHLNKKKLFWKNPTRIISWNPSPVWAAVSIPFLACLSVQVVLQARMARNLEGGIVAIDLELFCC